MQFQPVDRQLLDLTRGAEDVIDEPDLRQRLQESIDNQQPLRVKLGIDPSSPDIHLGHTVVLRRLQAFQEHGHRVILIIGDYTAMVGDPSGRNKTRPQLTLEQVEGHARTYLEQAAKIVDLTKAEVRRNSEWFSKMSFLEVLKLTARSTVARMLERDDFTKRYAANVSIGLHEFLYPLMQGWDSVMVRADVEIGGTDQLFNLLMGRKIQEQEEMRAQVVITSPIIAGLDGEKKMSKSLGNTIGVTDAPDKMFGKTMSIGDHLLRQWFTLLTREPEEQIERLVDPDQTEPMDAKKALAHLIVQEMHGASAAVASQKQFEAVIQGKALPEDMKEVTIELTEGKVAVWALVRQARGVSGSEARRLVRQGGVHLIQPGEADSLTLEDEKAALSKEELTGRILRIGKRHFYRLKV